MGYPCCCNPVLGICAGCCSDGDALTISTTLNAGQIIPMNATNGFIGSSGSIGASLAGTVLTASRIFSPDDSNEEDQDERCKFEGPAFWNSSSFAQNPPGVTETSVMTTEGSVTVTSISMPTIFFFTGPATIYGYNVRLAGQSYCYSGDARKRWIAEAQIEMLYRLNASPTIMRRAFNGKRFLLEGFAGLSKIPCLGTKSLGSYFSSNMNPEYQFILKFGLTGATGGISATYAV